MTTSYPYTQYGGIWKLNAASAAKGAGTWPAPPVPGQVAYTTPGTYTWTCPPNITSVSVVCIGGGGGANGSSAGGSGGGLGYKNNYPVTPGNTYTVVVGAGGVASADGNDSYFVSTSVVKGGKGFTASATGGSYTGDGGGTGGGGGPYSAGGGAGGYSGNGGNAPAAWSSNGNAGSGGGGGSGATGTDTISGGTWPYQGSPGGGTGILGQGSNGSAGLTGTPPTGGGGGSGGTAGVYTAGQLGTTAGKYGGGGSGQVYGGSGLLIGNPGGDGAVRIIWPGNTRQFPSTNTGDL